MAVALETLRLFVKGFFYSPNKTYVPCKFMDMRLIVHSLYHTNMLANFFLAKSSMINIIQCGKLMFSVNSMKYDMRPYSQDILPDDKPRMVTGLGLPGIWFNIAIFLLVNYHQSLMQNVKFSWCYELPPGFGS